METGKLRSNSTQPTLADIESVLQNEGFLDLGYVDWIRQNRLSLPLSLSLNWILYK